MRKVLLHIILLIMLFDITGLHQLYKLPMLARHYAEHKNLDHNISFVRFFSMHYLGQDIHDDDDEKDNQLPFKRVEVISIHFYFVPLVKEITCKVNTRTLVRNYPKERRDFYYNPALEALFRPPKA